MVANEEGAIYTLIATYYNAMATGDEETLRSVCDEISDKDMYRYVELSQYIDYYPTLEIYTKTGPEEGSVIAYVYYKISFVGHEEEVPGYQALYICTNDQGGLYIKRGENSEEVNEYIKTVSTQDDVVEFNNKITVEYNELMVDHPEVLQYISELDSQVSIAVGEKLANQVAAETPSIRKNISFSDCMTTVSSPVIACTIRSSSSSFNFVEAVVLFATSNSLPSTILSMAVLVPNNNLE